MKKFKSNFTTPEQSKRLLELGLPANSADCYYNRGFNTLFFLRNTEIELRDDFFDYLNNKQQHFPIWSTGRLINILTICDLYCDFTRYAAIPINTSENLINYLIRSIEFSVNSGMIIFSRLEDYEKTSK